MATRSQSQAQKNVAVANKLVGTIGSMTDKLVQLREQKQALEAQVKTLSAEYEQVEKDLLERLEAEGSTKGSGKLGTCSISTSIVGNVTDWSLVDAYVIKHKATHLYQRRLSDPAWRELAEKGKPIPGIEPFTKVRLNVRSNS